MTHIFKALKTIFEYNGNIYDCGLSGVCRSGSSGLASDDPGVKGTLGYPEDIHCAGGGGSDIGDAGSEGAGAVVVGSGAGRRPGV